MRERQHLLIDADDTLWENNIYFEQAFDEFVQFLDHSTLSHAEVRAILDEIELVNNKIHGYGSENFGRNMRQCYERLCERQVQPGCLDTVMQCALRIMEQPLEVLPGVEDTLEYLASRHDLILCTKGHQEEQKLKIERSGLSVWFGHAEVVREKDEAAYRELVSKHRLSPERTWMIGNSPKSDINPALAAGLQAVYVPHERTWHLERTELAEALGRLLKIEQFSDLRQHF